METEDHFGNHPNEFQNLATLCRSMFDGSPLPMAVVLGARHKVFYGNLAFCRFVGKKQDDVIGIPFAEAVPEHELLAILDRVYTVGETETHPAPEQSRANLTYGSYTVWPVLSANQRPRGAVIQVTETARLNRQATAMNQELLLSAVRQHELTETAERLSEQLQLEITERKRMERALVVNEKLAVTARFALTMAHEINNPLEAITNIMFLLAPLQNTAEAQGYVHTLEEQIQGLSRISTQMLKFHRDSNQPTRFELSTVLREVVDFYRSHAETHGVIVRQRVETEGIIVGFRSEAVQLLTNLLLNALDATPARGQVIVHLYPAPHWLCEIHDNRGYCVSIADSGNGIDPEHRARIFEPFFTTKGDRGTGLGLWVSLGIVNRAGGSIRVWSARRIGHSGTCFLVFLPGEHTITSARRREDELKNLA